MPIWEPLPSSDGVVLFEYGEVFKGLEDEASEGIEMMAMDEGLDLLEIWLSSMISMVY